MAEPSAPNQRKRKPGPGRPFKPGQSGNPAGRPKGGRNRLGEDFLSDLAADWKEHGAEAIAACRAEKPSEYVKIVAGILPKELLVRTDPIDEMTDAELDDIIDLVGDYFAAISAGASETSH